MKIITLCFSLLGGTLCFSQMNIDSLLSVWNDASKPDTIRLAAVKEVAQFGYVYTNQDSSIYLANEYYAFAKKGNHVTYMAAAKKTLGIANFMKGNYNKAIAEMDTSYHISLALGDISSASASISNMGIIYKNLGDYPKSVECYNRGLILAESINDSESIANTYSNLGVVYYFQEEYDKALAYHEKAFDLNMDLDLEYKLAGSWNNIGLIYERKGDYQKTIDCYIKALELYRKYDNYRGEALCLSNIGVIYESMGDLDSALINYKKALVLNEKIGFVFGQISNTDLIATNYYFQGKFQQSIELANKALRLALQTNEKEQIGNISHHLYLTYQKLGRYKEALDMFELSEVTRDSLRSEQSQKEIIHQEYEYSYEKQFLADSIKNVEINKVKNAELETEKVKSERAQLQSYVLFGGLFAALIVGVVLYNRFKKSQEQKTIIEDQKLAVDNAYEQLAHKNTEIMDSIAYAKRIQTAILPPEKLVKQYLENSFVLYKPKDIVAGDFYWMEPLGQTIYFAAADCTGHGVPGAMVSVICNGGLNRSVREFKLKEPGEILDKTRELVIQEFEKSEEEMKDGMDIALCSLEGRELKYAGAHNPLWIVRDGSDDIEEIKANKQPIGKFDYPTPYDTHTIQLNKGDTFYIFSDGYVDQFGGEKGKKFKAKAFRELLLSMSSKSMEEQRILIDETFESWRGNLEQIDDVCVIGVRIP
jgi:serine phosphatase RsbU (regulator of sigma subunit)/Tfp pilus assembly protein PilF